MGGPLRAAAAVRPVTHPLLLSFAFASLLLFAVRQAARHRRLHVKCEGAVMERDAEGGGESGEGRAVLYIVAGARQISGLNGAIPGRAGGPDPSKARHASCGSNSQV